MRPINWTAVSSTVWSIATLVVKMFPLEDAVYVVIGVVVLWVGIGCAGGGLAYGLWQLARRQHSGRVLCAWCGKFLHYAPGLPKGQTSHGICLKCMDKMTDKLEAK